MSRHAQPKIFFQINGVKVFSSAVYQETFLYAQGINPQPWSSRGVHHPEGSMHQYKACPKPDPVSEKK